MTTTPFGPTGATVYARTYSRPLPFGGQEEWGDTVRRVAAGNLSLLHGRVEEWPREALDEYEELVEYMEDFRIIPAGRHLWASGVMGRQYLFNCHVSGWGERLSRHFEFTFLRLMEGGGVGANYSTPHLLPYGAPRRHLTLHIVCDPAHPDYADLADAGVLSDRYQPGWHGAHLVEDSREGWANALTDLMDTFMTDEHVRHEARVYDVSIVRRRGALLRTFGGTASGPLPFARMLHEVTRVLNGAAGRRPEYAHIKAYDGRVIRTVDTGAGPEHLTPVEAMEVAHAVAECVVSGGVRRSARMSIVRWDDPYIDEFLACKADGGAHWTTNISVEVNDEFFRAYRAGDPKAVHVFEAVAAGMLSNGEPGFWNSTLSNVGEPNPVLATNPCGEIALTDWEPCNLGHVNLSAFPVSGADGQIARAHRLVTRFLMRATYGDVNDAEQADVLARNRRIGVGHMGVQGYLAKRGIRYSEAPRHSAFRDELTYWRGIVQSEAREFAHELRIPVPVKATAIAPTGSIAKLPGVSEGIHPIYGRYFIRRVRFNVTDPAQNATVAAARAAGHVVEPDVYDKSGHTMVVEYPTKDTLVEEVEGMGYESDVVEAADELSVDQMLAFQRLYQTHYADNAVSYTVNVAPDALTPGDLVDVLAEFLPDLKGTTLMVDESREQSPYERLSREEFEQYAQHLQSVADGIDEECAAGGCPIK